MLSDILLYTKQFSKNSINNTSMYLIPHTHISPKNHNTIANYVNIIKKVKPALIIIEEDVFKKYLNEHIYMRVFNFKDHFDWPDELKGEKSPLVVVLKDFSQLNDKEQLCCTKIVNRIIEIRKENGRPYSFQLPDWCYSADYILIDIQFNKHAKSIIYKFRHKDGAVKYYKTASNKNYFYVDYSSTYDNCEPIKHVSEVNVRLDSSDLSPNIARYESDLPIELKHSVDYSFNRKVDEPDYKIKKLFWDIEVYNDGERAFPFPNKAEKMINAISFKFDEEPVHIYLTKHSKMDRTTIVPISNFVVKFFDTEQETITAFINKVHEYDVDIMAGWNTAFFDLPYLVNRMIRIGMDYSKISPIGNVYINSNNPDDIEVFGMHMLDQLLAYKKIFTQGRESYTLSYIATYELGKDKVAYDGTLDTLYEGDINKFIEYSGIDTELLWELESKLKHIDLIFELIKVCSSTWKRSRNTLGLVDPLVVKFAKNNNKVLKDKPKYSIKEPFDGAYVIPPKIGLHKWVIDFDFKSLYPSIICSFNLCMSTFRAKVSADIAKLYLYDRENLPDIINILKEPIYAKSEYEDISKDEFIKFIDNNNLIMCITGCMFNAHSDKVSFLTEILEHVMSTRDKYKKMKNNALGEKYSKELTEDQIEEYDYYINRYDAIQLTYKIIANSIYGATSNRFFRLYKIDISESITLTGQEALKFSVHHLSKYMKTGEFNVDNDYLDNFEGTDFDYITYGDSVTKDSKIQLDTNNCMTIEELWNSTETDTIQTRGKEVKQLNNVKVLSSSNHVNKFLECTEIIRHKVDKKIYRLYLTNENYVEVTEDHGIINYDDNLKYKTVKPIDCEYVLVNYKVYDYDETVMLVTKIEEIEYNDYVYDLCVPETQNFYANDILVHNTDSLFISIGEYIEDNNIEKD